MSQDKEIRIHHMDAVAIRKSGVEGWEPFKYEAVGEDSIITGGIPRLLTRGPRKGKRTWDGCKDTSVVVTRGEIAIEEARFVAATGKCHRCYGDGQVFSSWHHIEGTKYRKCDYCDGTGEATDAAIEARIQSQRESATLTRCAADRDGDCVHSQCPQLRDGEPKRSGRHCPLDTEE